MAPSELLSLFSVSQQMPLFRNLSRAELHTSGHDLQWPKRNVIQLDGIYVLQLNLSSLNLYMSENNHGEEHYRGAVGIAEEIGKLCLFFTYMDLTKDKESFVESKISLVKGLHECTKLELEWLSTSLAEVLGAIKILDKFDILEEKRDNNSKLLEDAESESEVFQEQQKVVTEK
ncbi:hypothetical protein MTR_5g046650 [Medicago truncatula]|uniref:Uncharacterized protein n=1 Tax=Medicago truncatula TaxID=3880 RepID=G7JX03_MEDTR|nr:hypothetical protein MTR_5g046650 [Medicago truncatula]